jgi:hypothetical protein
MMGWVISLIHFDEVISVDYSSYSPRIALFQNGLFSVPDSPMTPKVDYQNQI